MLEAVAVRRHWERASPMRPRAIARESKDRNARFPQVRPADRGVVMVLHFPMPPGVH